MPAVDDFIYQYEGEPLRILIYLHELMTSIEGVTVRMRYRLPFYYMRSWICYLKPDQQGCVEFAFTRGNELSNQSGILESKGRKQVYSVTFSRVDEIPDEALWETIQEAVLLDESVRYAPKRESKRAKN